MEKTIKNKLIILAERLNTVCDDISPIFMKEQANRQGQNIGPSRMTMDLTSLVLRKPKINGAELTTALKKENNLTFSQYAQVINACLTKLEEIQFLKDNGLKGQIIDQPTQDNAAIRIFDSRLKAIEEALARGRNQLPNRMQGPQDSHTKREIEIEPDADEEDTAPEASETSSEHSSESSQHAEPAPEPTPSSSTSSFSRGSSHIDSEITIAKDNSDTSSATTEDGLLPQIIEFQNVWYELDLTKKKATLITHHPVGEPKTDDLGDVKISNKQITIFYARSGNKESLEQLLFDKNDYVTKGFKPARNETAKIAFHFALAPLHKEPVVINDKIEELKQKKKTAKKHHHKPTKKAALKEIKSDFQHLKIARKDMKKIEKIRKHNNGKIKIVGMGYTHPAKLALITSPIGVVITTGFAIGSLAAMVLITGGYTAATVPISTAAMTVVGACVAVPFTLVSGYIARFHPLAVNKMLTPVTLPTTATKKGAELAITGTNKFAHAVKSTTAAIKNRLKKATPEDGEKQLLLPEGPDESPTPPSAMSSRSSVSQVVSIHGEEIHLLSPEPDDGSSQADGSQLSDNVHQAFFQPKETTRSQSDGSRSPEETLDFLLSPLTERGVSPTQAPTDSSLIVSARLSETGSQDSSEISSECSSEKPLLVELTG